MIKSYLIVAVRNFLRQKSFALINIIGLAIGLASILLIFLYIQDELKYDLIHPKAENIYRVGYNGIRQDGSTYSAVGVPGGWTSQLKAQLPQVEESLRILWTGYPVSVIDKDNDKIVLTEEMMWVEPTFGNILHFEVVNGEKQHAFDLHNSMAISESAAKKMFRDENPIGRTLVFSHPWMTGGEEAEVIVSAVFEDYPSNSQVRPDYLVNYHVLNPFFEGEFNDFAAAWDRGWFQSYIRITDNADIAYIKEALNKMATENVGEDAANFDPIFRKIGDVHFDTEMPWTREGPGDMSYIIIFGSVAILILLIACINYMNLATARSAKRAREIGMRKTFGSPRAQLMFQFFVESLITSLIALCIAIGIIAIVLPYFNALSSKSFFFSDIFAKDIVAVFIIILLLVSFIAGSYPAIYLSGFSPIQALKSKLASGRKNEFLRKLLVVIQFCVSIILIIGAVVATKQMNFIGDSKLSQQGDRILSIRYGGTAPIDRYQTFKNSILQDANFDQVTMANHLPRQSFFGGINAMFTIASLSPEPYNWSLLNVDFDFVNTFGVEFLAGRNFDQKNLADSNAFMINAAALREMDIEIGEAIGLPISLSIDENRSIEGKIIAVIKDFPYRSIHETIGPLVISSRPHNIDQIVYVKLPSENQAEHIAALEEKWKQIFPGIGFDYWLIDDEFQKMYEAESRMADLITGFSVLAVIIACLGLFGLASYLAERRTKEIGIRKVMGASAGQMVVLLFNNFMKLLIIAIVIALPISYLLMNDWLQNFIYHTSLSWWIFALAVVAVAGLTIVTVGYESMKASYANPVDAIKQD